MSDQLFITTCPPGYCRCTISRETGVDMCHYVHNTRSSDFICSCQREGTHTQRVLIIHYFLHVQESCVVFVETLLTVALVSLLFSINVSPVMTALLVSLSS